MDTQIFQSLDILNNPVCVCVCVCVCVVCVKMFLSVYL